MIAMAPYTVNLPNPGRLLSYPITPRAFPRSRFCLTLTEGFYFTALGGAASVVPAPTLRIEEHQGSRSSRGLLSLRPSVTYETRLKVWVYKLVDELRLRPGDAAVLTEGEFPPKRLALRDIVRDEPNRCLFLGCCALKNLKHRDDSRRQTRNYPRHLFRLFFENTRFPCS
jgi:hypothetical protein